MKNHYSFVTMYVSISAILSITFYSGYAQTFPTGFTNVEVATGMIKPVAMTFAPDGRIFVAEQGGVVSKAAGMYSVIISIDNKQIIRRLVVQ